MSITSPLSVFCAYLQVPLSHTPTGPLCWDAKESAAKPMHAVHWSTMSAVPDVFARIPRSAVTTMMVNRLRQADNQDTKT